MKIEKNSSFVPLAWLFEVFKADGRTAPGQLV